MKSPWFGSFLLALLTCGTGIGCSGDDDGLEAVRLEPLSLPPARVAAAATVPVSVRALAADGTPRADILVSFEVRAGGGSFDLGDAVDADVVSVRTAADGVASAPWSVGIVPVVNRVSVSVGAEVVPVETRVELAQPLGAQMFGDIPQFLRDHGYSGVDMDGGEVFLASTEDLAFVGDRMLLGLSAGTSAVDGALVEVNAAGDAELIDLAGDVLVGTLGVAVDREGVLWVADPRREAVGALLRISTDGVVETVTTSDGENDLIGPNYVAVGPDDKIYVSDPCAGVILRYDPQAEVVDAVLTTDVASQGGANGLAFDASGENLYFATESIALLCARPDLDLIDPVAGLYRVTVDEAGFGPLEPIAERQGLFGDGLAFDIEGNLYVIFDTQANFMLAESAVWVLPAGESELVKFLATGDRVYANLAWGVGAFGEETVYAALLAVDAFGLPIRGVERIDIGIRGLPLLPD